MGAVEKLEKPMCMAAGMPREEVNTMLEASQGDAESLKALVAETEWDDNETSVRIKRARAIAKKMFQTGRERESKFIEGDGAECFKRWFAAQILAGKEVQKLADPDWAPSCLGAGAQSLFDDSSSRPENDTRKTPKIPGPGTYESIDTMGAPSPKYSFGDRRAPPAGDWTPGHVGVRAGGTQSVVTLHVGGAGCGLGTAMWERLFREHKISLDNGRTIDPDAFGSAATHFEESASGRLVPRSVFVDMDPEGLGAAQGMGCFSPVDLLEAFGSAGGNWGVAYRGQESLCSEVLEAIRRHAEKGTMQGLMVTHCLFGGTGGGLTAKLLTDLSADMPKILKWNVCLTQPLKSDEMSHTTQCAAVLGVPSLIEYCDMTTMMDNTALHSVCSSKNGLGIVEPGFADYNSLASRMLVACTSPVRFGRCISAVEGSRRLSLQGICTNMVPYPRIHFTVASVAPLINESMADFATDVASDCTWKGFTQGALSTVDRKAGKNIAVGVFCRNITQGDAFSAVNKYRSHRDCAFVDYVPTGFVVGSHRDPTCGKHGDVVCLYSNTVAH